MESKSGSGRRFGKFDVPIPAMGSGELVSSEKAERVPPKAGSFLVTRNKNQAARPMAIPTTAAISHGQKAEATRTAMSKKKQEIGR